MTRNEAKNKIREIDTMLSSTYEEDKETYNISKFKWRRGREKLRKYRKNLINRVKHDYMLCDEYCNRCEDCGAGES